MAKQLALTENQLTLAPRDRQETRAARLGPTRQDQGPSSIERDEAKRAFVREAEQAGFAILNEQQRSKLNKLAWP